MKDKLPGISLNDWLEDCNYQGLPWKNVKEGSLSYLHPRNNAVARFDANSGRVGLSCDGGAAFSYSEFGVRFAHMAEKI